MVEIHIERKERSALPWLLGIVLLLGLLWFGFARSMGDGVVASITSDSSYRDTSSAAGTLAPLDSAATVTPR